MKLIITLVIAISIPLAKAGMREAEECYQRGDYACAFKRYLTEAEKGNSHASYQTGMLLKLGLGTDKSTYEAIKWYTTAANAGHIKSLLHLGCDVSLWRKR